MSEYNIIFDTSEGVLRIALSLEANQTYCRLFVDCCSNHLFDDLRITKILPNFFIQFTTQGTYTTARKKTTSGISSLSFSETGIIGITDDGTQIIISLEPCNAQDTKYNIIGQIIPEDIPTLKKIATNENDKIKFPQEEIKVKFVKIVKQPNFLCTEEQSIPTPPSPKLQITPSTDSIPSPSRSRSRSTSRSRSPPKTRPSTPCFPQKRKILSVADTVAAAKRPRLSPQPMIRSPTDIEDSLNVIKTSSLQKFHKPRLHKSMSMPNLQQLQVPPQWPSRLVIIRHGESEQNSALDVGTLSAEEIDKVAMIRDADIKLTEKGLSQAAATGKYLEQTGRFDICFVSPYIRAIDTANQIISKLPYTVKIFKENCIREKEFGRLHGLQATHVEGRYPDEFKARQRDGRYWYRFPGGENYPDVEMRVNAFIDKCTRSYAGRSVLVVTHAVPYLMFRAIFQHLDETGVLALPSPPNCGIQEYILDRSKEPQGRLKLKMFNHIAYDDPIEEKNTILEK